MHKYSGLDYLRIDIANQMAIKGDDGITLDKRDFEDRLKWVHEYESDLELLVDLAHKPFQYLAAVMAYRDAQNHIPTGHMVGCDASASGLQMYAVLTGCDITAESTGLIGEHCKNMYKHCTEVMIRILGIVEEFPEKPVKKAIMTYFYGSKAKPKEVFGDGTPEHQAFFQAVHEVAPGACELLGILLDSWQSYALSHDWVMPDGFTVYIPVMETVETVIEVDELNHAAFKYQFDINRGTEKGRSVAANVAHSTDGMVVREVCRRCNYDSKQLQYVKKIIESELSQDEIHPGAWRTVPRHEALAVESGFCSIVGIEQVNEQTVKTYSHAYLNQLLIRIKRVFSHKSFPVVTIHDEFKAHPNNCNIVRQTYIDVMAEIAESNMLEFILSQIRTDYFEVEKYTDDLGTYIRQGEYGIS